MRTESANHKQACLTTHGGRSSTQYPPPCASKLRSQDIPQDLLKPPEADHTTPDFSQFRKVGILRQGPGGFVGSVLVVA